MSTEPRSASLLPLTLAWAVALSPCPAADCNLNGRDDDEELAAGDGTDCNADGFLDECELAALLTYGSQDVLLLGEPPQAVAPGDFDGDGRLDLAVLEAGGRSVVTFLNNGFELRPAAPAGACAGATALAAIDFDGDGLDEVAIGCGDERGVRIVDPLLDDEKARATLASPPVAVAAADLDGSDILDLVVAAAAEVVFLAGRPGGTLAEMVTVPGVGAALPSSLLAADVDGDSLVDAVVADASGNTVAVLFRDTERSVAVSVLEVGQEPVGVVAADLDSDGDLDIATANRGSLDITVLRNLGGRAFSAIGFTDSIETIVPSGLAAGDLNGDRWPDLALSGARLGSEDDGLVVRTLVGYPRGGFASAEDLAAGEISPSGPPASIIFLVDLFEGEASRVVVTLAGRPEIAVLGVQNEGGGDHSGDGVLDGCPTTLLRGDVSADGALDITDPVVVLWHLFLDGALDCLASGDIDDDGFLNLSDPILLLEFLFLGGPGPRAPFPGCGPDPTDDPLGCAVATCF
jgi:hypothetical protein